MRIVRLREQRPRKPRHQHSGPPLAARTPNCSAPSAGCGRAGRRRPKPRAESREHSVANTYRMYTGDDGQTHVEAIDLGSTPAWKSGLATTQISFRESPVGNFQDWHP